MKKEIIISFILGAIISSVVGVIAANTISSSSVLYKNDKTVNTVLDELYESVDAIESDDTRLTSLEGRVNTLTSTHSSDITRIDNSIYEVNNNLENKKTGTIIKIGTFSCQSKTQITFPDGYTKDDFSKIIGYNIINGYENCEVSIMMDSPAFASHSSYIEPTNTPAMIRTSLDKDDSNVYCTVYGTGGFSGVSAMEIYGVLK